MHARVGVRVCIPSTARQRSRAAKAYLVVLRTAVASFDDMMHLVQAVSGCTLEDSSPVPDCDAKAGPGESLVTFTYNEGVIFDAGQKCEFRLALQQSDAVFGRTKSRERPESNKRNPNAEEHEDGRSYRDGDMCWLVLKASDAVDTDAATDPAAADPQGQPAAAQ